VSERDPRFLSPWVRRAAAEVVERFDALPEGERPSVGLLDDLASAELAARVPSSHRSPSAPRRIARLVEHLGLDREERRP